MYARHHNNTVLPVGAALCHDGLHSSPRVSVPTQELPGLPCSPSRHKTAPTGTASGSELSQAGTQLCGQVIHALLLAVACIATSAERLAWACMVSTAHAPLAPTRLPNTAQTNTQFHSLGIPNSTVHTREACRANCTNSMVQRRLAYHDKLIADQFQPTPKTNERKKNNDMNKPQANKHTAQTTRKPLYILKIQKAPPNANIPHR